MGNYCSQREKRGYLKLLVALDDLVAKGRKPNTIDGYWIQFARGYYVDGNGTMRWGRVAESYHVYIIHGR